MLLAIAKKGLFRLFYPIEKNMDSYYNKHSDNPNHTTIPKYER